jgi:outer membrane biosynthesis protein TonB
MGRKTAERIGWALVVSLLIHATFVLLIQADPNGTPAAAGPRTLQARIERTTAGAAEAKDPDAAAPVERRSEPRPAVAAERTPIASPPSVREAADTARDETAHATAETSKKPVEAGGLELPFVRDPTYYAITALDAPPRLLGAADVCYPPGAAGEVAYLLLIDENGTVEQATLTAMKPAGLFAASAVEQCSRLKFSPGMKDGRPVKSRVRFVVGPSPG